MGDLEFPRIHASRYLVTHTMIECFLSCRRKCLYRYGYGLRLRPEDQPDALTIGTTVHRLLEEYHNVRANLNDPDGFTMRCREAADKSSPVPDDEAYLMAKALAIVDVYSRLRQRAWGEEAQMEVPFCGPIRNPRTGYASHKVWLGGKIDKLMRDDDGTWWLADHKTCQEVNDEAIKKAWLAVQQRRYMLYAPRPVQGAILNYLGKGYTKRRIGEDDAEFERRCQQARLEGRNPNRMRQKRDSTPQELYNQTVEALGKDPGRFFRREQVLISPHDKLQTKQELWDFAQEFLVTLRNGRWLRTTSACFRYNRACEYFDFCTAGGLDRINPNYLNRFEVVRGHPELFELPML
jgi:hypothetical protein